MGQVGPVDLKRSGRCRMGNRGARRDRRRRRAPPARPCPALRPTSARRSRYPRTARNRWSSHTGWATAVDVVESGPQTRDQLLGARAVHVPGYAAGPHQAAAKAAAANGRRGIQKVAAQPAAVGRGRQEADVAGQRAEVARVVGQPLSSRATPRSTTPGPALRQASASTAWQ